MTTKTREEQIADDVSYMRGQWDVMMPMLIKRVDEHEEKITGIVLYQGTERARMGVIATVFGIVGTGLMNFLSAHLNIKL